jgi:hypothetical protein
MIELHEVESGWIGVEYGEPEELTDELYETVTTVSEDGCWVRVTVRRRSGWERFKRALARKVKTR